MRADLLEVLPRLARGAARAARRRRRSRAAAARADRPAARDRPAAASRGTRVADVQEHPTVLVAEQRTAPAARSDRSAPRRGAAPAPPAPASDRRTKRERRNAAARRSDTGRGQIADQRDDVLDLVGVEEAEPLVDVGRNAAAVRARCSNSRWLARERNRIAMSPGVAGRGTPVGCRGPFPRAACARSRRPPRRRRPTGSSATAMPRHRAAPRRRSTG